ncbi:MAG: single-stranded DNA-binding protein [Bacteroidales bacterium]|jgi:single-strand DNA-binding protein
MNLNKVLLIGRLGKDPEVNYYKPDSPVAKFPLATSEYYLGKNGEKIESTEWHNIVCWNNNAKFAEKYLSKGMLVYIEGRITTRKWEANDKTTRYSTDIVVQDIKILEKKSDSKEPEMQTNQTAAQNQPTTTVDAPSTQPGNEVKISEEIDPNIDYRNDQDIDDDLPF